MALSLVLFLFFISMTSTTEAFDPLDPNGNITIKWDIMEWTADGYVATVTMFNYQKFRHIQAPGWSLGWSWDKKEVIWSIFGANVTEHGDCSKFKGDKPQSCTSKPTIVDLSPDAPYNMQISNCCKSGVLSSWIQDPADAVSSFQLAVGMAGTSNRTVRLPKNFTLGAPGPGYTCGKAKVMRPTRFVTPDGRRTTQAIMTWGLTCAYSQFLAHKIPTCCVSLSSFYNNTIVNCPTCSCGCRNNKPNCVEGDSPRQSSFAPLVKCTSHMCPVGVHWHVKQSYKDHWRVKVTITNFNYRTNYTQWNLVARHPNFDNSAKVFSFHYKKVMKDMAMLWGIEPYNDVLMEAGPRGHVESEILLRKDASTFVAQKGWAFPLILYLNGDYCVMPEPSLYPYVPKRNS